MIIGIEGPDGAGKTTLTQKLHRELGIKTFHSGRPTTPKEMEQLLSDLELMGYSQQLFIVDRLPWISELVYAKAMGRTLLINDCQYKESLEIPQTVIYCRPENLNHLRMDRSPKTHKPQEFMDSVDLKRNTIVELYDSLIDRLSFSNTIYSYDYTREQQYKKIKKIVKSYM